MSAINPAQAALTRWMRPSVARSWIAQITRHSRYSRCARSRREAERVGEAARAFRTLLTRDWVVVDLWTDRRRGR